MPDRSILRYACDICRRPNTCVRSDSACDICKSILGAPQQADPHQAQDVVHVAEWLADAACRRAAGIGTEPPACTCGIGGGFHTDRCPVFAWGHKYKIGFGHNPARDARSIPPQAESFQNFERPSIAIAKAIVNHATQPLVSAERRRDIQLFARTIQLVEEAYGLKLRGDTDLSGDVLIFDHRNPLPNGYEFSAYIEPNGQLEFTEYVLEDEESMDGKPQ